MREEGGGTEGNEDEEDWWPEARKQTQGSNVLDEG